MTIHIAASANAEYLGKMGPWLEHVQEHAEGPVELITLDSNPSEIEKKFSKVKVLPLQSSLVSCKNQHSSPQYGDFIHAYKSIPPEDIIIFVDGDCLMQRPLAQKELEKISSYKYSEIGVNMNAGFDDNLLQEAYRLGPKTTALEFEKKWWPGKSIPPCYNTGVVVARADTWKSLASDFTWFWNDLKAYLHNPSAQWLMSWIISTKYAYNVDLLPLSFHTHNHFGLYPGITVKEDGTTYHNDELVLFRHKIAWNPDKSPLEI